MIQFEPVTAAEEGLVDYFGIVLLLALAFYLISLYRIVRACTKAQSVSLSHLLLMAAGVLSLLAIFGDVTLLSDIGNQYEHGLSQPEWGVLYLSMAFQLLTIVALIYANLTMFGREDQAGSVARDGNAFLLAQYVGAICGLLGLFLMSLRFFFPTPLWMVKAHTTAATIILLIPYGLIVVYWVVVKLREHTGEWYDEKQFHDIGASSFLTLASSIFVMSILFILNYDTLNGLLSVLWFPFYAFLVLFLFSAFNLYWNRDSVR
jgi:hypothetical protein